jgi:hypothetical protein
MVLALATGLCLVAVDAARAGRYTVVECGLGAGSDAEWVATAAWFARESSCGTSPVGPAEGVQGGAFLGTSAAAGSDSIDGQQYAGWRWLYPSGVHLERLTGFEWHALPGGLLEEIGWRDESGNFWQVRNAAGVSAAAPLVVEFPAGGSGFEVRVACVFPAGSRCPLGGGAWWRLWGLTLTLEDELAPAASITGAVAAPGWKRGDVAAGALAADGGSGVRLAETRVDGARVALVEPACQSVSLAIGTAGTRMQPCPATVATPVMVPTAGFADGAHELRQCALDFSGIEACSPPRPLLVDNGAPQLAFVAPRPGEEPQRVEVTAVDPASGVAAGRVAYRRAGESAWTALPTRLRAGASGPATLLAAAPDATGGRLFFQAEASDAAGNTATTTLCSDGSPMVLPALSAPRSGGGPGGARGGTHGPGGDGSARLESWLGAGAGHVSSLTVAFGQGARLHGRLVDGLGGRRIKVGVRFARGAGRARRTETTRTAADGSFELRLPPGPSRTLSVSIAGAGPLVPARSRPLHLRVRAGVSLAAEPSRLRTGDTVVFSGRVRPGGATVPRPGKLVTISYLERAGHRWRPVLVTRTDHRGRFRTSYRFRYVTGLARIRLRATAPAEARWPYAPGFSRPLEIEVRG